MQAAVGVAQLQKLPGFIKARRANFHHLHESLEEFGKFLILPEATPSTDPSWFGFPIAVREDAPFSRADLINQLEDRGIATRLLFGGNLIRQPAYAGIHYRTVGGLKATDFVTSQLFWIGLFPGISRAMIQYVKESFEAICQTVTQCQIS